jgi:hypothetical protein
MNERFKELAEQATYTVKGANGCVWGDNVSIEKFAELIVRECSGVIADAVAHREPASTYVSKIETHFGV